MFVRLNLPSHHSESTNLKEKKEINEIRIRLAHGCLYLLRNDQAHSYLFLMISPAAQIIWFVGFIFIAITCGISWYHIGLYGCSAQPDIASSSDLDGSIMMKFSFLDEKFEQNMGTSCIQKNFFLFPLMFSGLAILCKSSFLVVVAAMSCGLVQYSFYGIGLVRLCLFWPKFVYSVSGNQFITEVGVAGIFGWIGQLLCVWASTAACSNKNRGREFKSDYEIKFAWVKGIWTVLIITSVGIITIALNFFLSDADLEYFYVDGGYFLAILAPSIVENTLLSLIFYLMGIYYDISYIFYVCCYFAAQNIAYFDFVGGVDLQLIFGLLFGTLFLVLLCVTLSFNFDMHSYDNQFSGVGKMKYFVLGFGQILLLISLILTWYELSYACKELNCSSYKRNFAIILLCIPFIASYFKSYFVFCFQIAITNIIITPYIIVDLAKGHSKYLYFSAGILVWIGHFVSIIGVSLFLVTSSSGIVDRSFLEVYSRKFMVYIGNGLFSFLLFVSVVFGAVAVGLELNLDVSDLNFDSYNSLLSCSFDCAQALICIAVYFLWGFYLDNDALKYGSVFFSFYLVSNIQFVYDCTYFNDVSLNIKTRFIVGFVFASISILLATLLSFFSSKETSYSDSFQSFEPINEVFLRDDLSS